MAVILITSGPNFTGTGASGNALRLVDKVTAGAYTNVDITVNDQGLITAIANGSPGGGGGATEYDAGSGGLTNFWVRGGAGIVVTSPNPGEYVIAVPDGIILQRFWYYMDNFGTDLDGSGNAQVTITHLTSGVNTNQDNAKVPHYVLTDGAGNQRDPGDIAITPQLTSVAGGSTVQTIAGLNGLGSPLRLVGIV